MTLQQAMLNLDGGMPMWLRIAGDVSARFTIGVCAIIIAGKLLLRVLQ